MQELALSDLSRIVSGVVLITIVTIEFGGFFLLRVASGGGSFTPFQKSFFRAGHAHAGVLVTLSLVTLLLADAASLDGPLGWLARLAVPGSAILIPAGFFFSAMGGEATRPNRFVLLIWAGAALLALGVLTLGTGLLIS
ncbi:hypothetical protein [Nocardiopsis sp. ATB16-24]|uniref:hypothetical protein n=1 Tax=Nocardiopsis sp. ATB16-24 TaxID=3019555 RepID=UPI0025571586|nr:hypothetical protein [Nocardiopsis sp. ATB16-24]